MKLKMRCNTMHKNTSNRDPFARRRRAKFFAVFFVKWGSRPPGGVGSEILVVRWWSQGFGGGKTLWVGLHPCVSGVQRWVAAESWAAWNPQIPRDGETWVPDSRAHKGWVPLGSALFRGPGWSGIVIGPCDNDQNTP